MVEQSRSWEPTAAGLAAASSCGGDRSSDPDPVVSEPLRSAWHPILAESVRVFGSDWDWDWNWHWLLKMTTTTTLRRSPFLSKDDSVAAADEYEGANVDWDVDRKRP